MCGSNFHMNPDMKPSQCQSRHSYRGKFSKSATIRRGSRVVPGHHPNFVTPYIVWWILQP